MRGVITKGMAMNEQLEVHFEGKDAEQFKVRAREAFDLADMRAHELNVRALEATAATKSPEVMQEVQHILGMLHGRVSPELQLLQKVAEESGHFGTLQKLPEGDNGIAEAPPEG